ncbi:MAG TPA: bifunctional riboflavin kinase/FAD synthetase [Candidatus Binatia bacterium]|nr:bifunctional riboflavin kinase/FAD synthetase [Candidatus Binatia bacterium]
MRVVRHLIPGASPFRTPVVALGNFDGFHLGHRAIVDRTIARARASAADAVVFSFWPHPVAVLAPDRAPPMITSLSRRLALLADLALEGVVVRRFTRAFSALAPDDFVRDVLVGTLGVSAVVVGYNVTFGHNRTGTPDVLRELGAALGFAVEVVPPVLVGGRQVSSSEIRRELARGDVGGAAGLLGREHFLVGQVRAGDRRGAALGFPTANVLPRGGMLPPDGVYAVRVGIDREEPRRPGVANLGSNPTFGSVPRRLETHLFDFAGDLYGRRLTVAFVDRLRGELKFPSVEALREQIRADADAARAVLAAKP